MSMRFKINKIRDGFSVWKLKDFGCGFAWEDTGRRFPTKEKAKIYIDNERKRGEKNDGGRENEDDTSEKS